LNIQITVIAAPKVEHVANGKGGYDKVELTYKDQDGRVSQRKLVSFTNQDLFNKVKAARIDETYSVNMEKGEKYWEWKSFEPSMGEPSMSSSVVSSTAPRTAAPASPAAARIGNYETSEERAARQRYIVRQSSISAALDFTKHNANKAAITVDEVLDAASRFEAFVFGEKLDEKADPFAGFQDDIPE
jgi:hypothetical protein